MSNAASRDAAPAECRRDFHHGLLTRGLQHDGLHDECGAALVSRSMSLGSLRSDRRKILELATRHGAQNVRVFGSTVRGEAGAISDVDLLVEVEAGRTLLDVIAFEQDLEEFLGCSVEVLTDAGLSPYLQPRILAEAAVL